MSKASSAPERRAEIAAAADRVFYRDGFADVGIDSIAAEADVALATLYRHFRGRTDLVVSALGHREQQFFAFLEQSAEGLDGEARVLDLFAALHAWSERQSGNGCLFLRAASAHPHEPAVRAVALAHKRAYLEVVRRRLLEGGWSDAKARQLAPQLFLLLEGAVASAGVLGDGGAAKGALAMARALLRATPPDR